MIKHNLTSAWRNLRGTKFYSFINIAGLAIGLATAILLLLWVNHEYSYDRFHSDYARTYRILTHFEANGEDKVWESVPGPLYGYSQSIPSIQSVVRVNHLGRQVIANADRSKVLDGFSAAFVDSTFLNVFDFHLVDGHLDYLFPNNNSVVITQATAIKFFGNEDPLGQILQCRDEHFTVSGVLHDFPDNSSLRFDVLFPMGYYAAQFTANGGNGDWKTIDSDLGNYYYETYVKLQNGATPEVIASAVTEAYSKASNGELDVRYTLQPLESMHLVSADGNDAPARMVRIFLIVAILILAIASVNYINLSTARALARSQEVGIRKVIGASRIQLFLQFILETTLLFGFAVIIALGLVYALLPAYHRVTGVSSAFSLTDAAIWNVVAKTAIGMLLASAIYPALLLSDFRPLQALKGKFSSRLGVGRFRQVLVVFQFATSIVLIVATMVIGRQLDHIKHVDLGYDKEYVFTVPLPAGTHRHADALKNELENHFAIKGVSRSDIDDLSYYESSTGDLDWAGKSTDKLAFIHQAVVDKDFISVMGMELLDGRNFSGTPADSNHYILNEAAIKEMGLEPPFVGQTISFHSREGTVIGIVKDFNFQPLKKSVEPMLFFRWWEGNVLYVRTSAQHVKEAVEAAEVAVKQYAGDQPFHYQFLDDQFEAKYISDQRAGLLFNVFAGIAFFISCLGLLGLSTHTVRQRVKEIGIRKVLGASVGDVVALLSEGSLRLVLIAIIAGSPIAWWLMNQWLADFAYRIDIQWWMFAVAGLVAVVIALLTVATQAIRAAVANPVDSLRDE